MRTILGLTLGLGLGRAQRRSLHLSLLWLGLPWRGLAKLRKGPLGWRLHGLLLQLHAHVRRDLVRVRVSVRVQVRVRARARVRLRTTAPSPSSR